MGDRTTVSVTVLPSHKIKAINLIKEEDGLPGDEGDASNICWLTYFEVNYGTLEGLNQFQREGIPYTVEWDAGGDYCAGSESLRFTPEGTAKFYSSSKEWPEEILRECITEIKEAAASGSKTALEILEEKLNQHSTPSWENQEALAKLYLATQLITPNQ